MPADSMAAIMMPERIRLFEDSPGVFCPDEWLRKRTKNRVAKAPVKANKGTETIAAERLSKIAMLAPKAAPADTPRV